MVNGQSSTSYCRCWSYWPTTEVGSTITLCWNYKLFQCFACSSKDQHGLEDPNGWLSVYVNGCLVNGQSSTSLLLLNFYANSSCTLSVINYPLSISPLTIDPSSGLVGRSIMRLLKWILLDSVWLLVIAFHLLEIEAGFLWQKRLDWVGPFFFGSALVWFAHMYW